MITVRGEKSPENGSRGVWKLLVDPMTTFRHPND